MTKKSSKKSNSKSTPKMPVMALSQVEEKEILLDTKTVEKIEDLLAKNGGEKSGLTTSDIVAHILLEKAPNGFKFDAQKNDPKSVRITLPKSAWQVAEKSAQKSGEIEISEVIKELVARY